MYNGRKKIGLLRLGRSRLTPEFLSVNIYDAKLYLSVKAHLGVNDAYFTPARHKS